MSEVLRFQNIARSYWEGRPVLNDVSFSLSRGEVAGLLGRNGTGKTTLIRIAMGLLNPHAGSVRVFDLDPMVDPVAVKRRIGFVAEDQIFPSSSSPAELFALHQGLYPRWDEHLKDELLSRFRLTDKLGSSLESLSKGQAREVALICAIAHRPDLLILDEPAGGLDPSARRTLLEASIQTLADCGSAILFSTHHMTDIERLGGRVILLDEGRVRLDSGLRQLLNNTCIAVVPKSSAPDSASLIALAGCLGVRSAAETWHAVFEGDPAAVESRIKAELQTEHVECGRAGLEELFVDLVGERE